MKKKWKYGRKVMLLALPLCLSIAIPSFAEKPVDHVDESGLYGIEKNIATPSQPSKEKSDSSPEKVKATPSEPTQPDILMPTEVKWDESRPGWANLNLEELSQEDLESIKFLAIQIYFNGDPIDYQSGYQEKNDSMIAADLRFQFKESGEYQFRVALCSKRKEYKDIQEWEWSELSDSYDFLLDDLKQMSRREGVECLNNGVIQWKKVSGEEAYSGKKAFVLNIYKKQPDGEYEFEGMSFRYTEGNVHDGLTNFMEEGATYQIEVIAVGDLINYAHSEPSERVTFTVEDQVSDGKRIIDDLAKGNVKENVEKTNLSAAEKGALQTATQISSEAAVEYANLEEEYRDAAGRNPLAINHDESIITVPPTVIGAILNGATGIKFEKSNSNATGYSKYSAVNITLEGNGTSGELRFPVLITMTAPSGIDSSNLVIVHVKHDGTKETIYPRINDDGTVSFAVTQFSTFFFIDESSKEENGSSNGSNNSGSSGDSGGRVVSAPKSGSTSKISETPGQWQETEAGWQFRKSNGELYQNTWIFVKGNWYWIEPTSVMAQGWKELNEKKYYLVPVSGEMKTGWLFDINSWYYMEESGAMKIGWIQVNGNWYYLNTDGKMASDTVTPDGYKVNINGAWIQ